MKKAQTSPGLNQYPADPNAAARKIWAGPQGSRIALLERFINRQAKIFGDIEYTDLLVSKEIP
ncbi:MAG: hypothetical protein ABFS17_13435 [Chloroflexota bacterium]